MLSCPRTHVSTFKCFSSRADVVGCECWYNLRVLLVQSDPKKVFPPVEPADLTVRRHSVEFGMSEFPREEPLLCAKCELATNKQRTLMQSGL